ncbi:MAG: hypothetical protein U9O78_03765, partial [Patescibacteria group bacterium]|nr:hypothetical protein [Patescibacteria group bacterium]
MTVTGDEQVGYIKFGNVLDETTPQIKNLEVSPQYLSQDLDSWSGPITDELYVRAEVTDPSGIVAVSANFAYSSDFSLRPSPTSVAMHHVSGDIYEVMYEIPEIWDSGTLYVKVAARDNTSSGNLGRSPETKEVQIDNQQLEIINVSTDKSLYGKGQSVELSVTVKNVGQVPITDGRLKIGLDRSGSRIGGTGQEYFFADYAQLGVGEERIITFNQPVLDGWNGDDYWFDVAAYGQKFPTTYWYDAANRAVDVSFDTIAPNPPENLGFNTTVADYSQRPVETECGGYTKLNQVSHHWTEVGDAVEYQRQWVYPGNDPDIESNWHGAENWSTLYTNYLSFGGGSGTEGLWHVRVRARDDAYNWSGYSEACAINYDATKPNIFWDAPADGSIWNSAVNLEAHADETLKNLRFKWKAPEQKWSDVTGQNINISQTNYDYSLEPVDDGVYDLRAQGRDLALNWNRADDIQITIDRTNLKITSIGFNKADPIYKAGDILGVTLYIKNNGPISTNESMNQLYAAMGLDRYTCHNHMVRSELDLPSIEAGETGELTFDFLVPQPGLDPSNPEYWTDDADYTVSSVLRMRDGYKDYDSNNANYKFEIDNTAPVAEITNPGAGWLIGIVDIRGSVEDKNPDHYYLVIKDDKGKVVAGPKTVNRDDSFT